MSETTNDQPYDLRAELSAERATTESLLHALALIREAGGWHTQMLSELPSAAKAMREQRDAAIKDRDEARRDACAFEGIIRFNQNPKGIISTEAVLVRAKAIAALRGWDCYGEGGGA